MRERDGGRGRGRERWREGEMEVERWREREREREMEREMERERERGRERCLPICCWIHAISYIQRVTIIGSACQYKSALHKINIG